MLGIQREQLWAWHSCRKPPRVFQVCVSVAESGSSAGVSQMELSPSWLCHGLVWVAEPSLLCLLGFLMPSLTCPHPLNCFTPVVLSLLSACSLTDRSQCEQAQNQCVYVLFHGFIHIPPACLCSYSLLHTTIVHKHFSSLYPCFSSDFCLLPHYKTILHQKLPFHTKHFTLGQRLTSFGDTRGHKNVRTRM